MQSTDRPARSRISLIGWLLPAMALVISLGLSYGAYTLASYSWDQVVSYKSPYETMSGMDFTGVRPSLTDPIPGATPRRVVVVLIDGLRDDASRTMASISGLRARGADVRLTVPQPSLSYPTWTTIVTGAPQQISGVTTNWFEGPVKVETLFDVAAGSGRKVIISGTDDLDEMFRASEVATATNLIEWNEEGYTSDVIVDNALALDEQVGGADFAFVLLPDVDIAGHDFGGTSKEYTDVVAKVDADLGRLIDGLDDGNTTFVVLPDHGHLDTGGHGGWEEPVIHTFAAFAGPGVAQTTAEAPLQDVAPTIAVLAGLQAPEQAIGTAIDAVLADENGSARQAEFVHSAGLTLAYIREVSGSDSETAVASISTPENLAAMRAKADADRLAKERSSRMALLIGALLAVLVFAAVLAITAWRALVAALMGTVAYAALYNALFFLVHRFAWSLSAFNEETQVQAFFNQRMLEAALAGLFACVIASLTYSALRKRSRAPKASRSVEWIALGSATVLAVQATLVVQVAVFLWRWGAQVTWILPNMREAFKYDLDLIQLTALGAAALLGPLVVWLIGRIFTRTKAPVA
jgi:hypothetical protein